MTSDIKGIVLMPENTVHHYTSQKKKNILTSTLKRVSFQVSLPFPLVQAEEASRAPPLLRWTDNSWSGHIFRNA